MQLPLEILTVYLSIGAPFGVYFFLINHQSRGNSRLFFLSVFVAFVWVFYAVTLLRHFDHRALFSSDSHSSREQEIQIAAQNLLSSISNVSLTGGNVSFFDLKETVERYVGLTLALQAAASDAQMHEAEILRVVGRKSNDLHLGAACLHRRNLARLRTHQIRARAEFLRILTNDLEASAAFFAAALNLVEKLDDTEATRSLKRIQNKIAVDNKAEQTIAQPEKDGWKQLPGEQTFTLQSQASRINLTSARD